MTKGPTKPEKETALPKDIPLSGADALAEYDDTYRDAQQLIEACFTSVSELVGNPLALYLFAEIVEGTKPVGRPPGMTWPKRDLDIWFAYQNAPLGQKTAAATKVGAQDGRTYETTQKQLQRLKKDWKTMSEARRHWLLLDYYQPEQEERASAEVFRSVIETKQISDTERKQ